MIATWRFVVATICAVLAYVLAKPVMEMLLNAIRARVDKRIRWITDVQRYLLVYLSWLTFSLLLLLIASDILQLKENDDVMQALLYIVAIPVVLVTFALRKVVTNSFIRHFQWDRQSTDYDARIFVVTETITFACVALIVIEVFFIFFVSSELAGFLLVEIFLCFEIVAILSGFTMLKNVATGFFLIFAEPFRTGSLCTIRNLVGYIERVSLARTTMRRPDGSLVFVPNGVFSDWHQTSGNASDLQTHEVMLQIHPATPFERIQRLMEELMMVLQEFAMLPEVTAPGTAYSGGDSLLGTPQSMLSRALESRAFSSLSTETRNDQHTLCVALHAMYKVKVSLMIDRAKFQSLEEVKTEV